MATKTTALRQTILYPYYYTKRTTPPTYSEGDKVWIKHTLHKDAYSKSQASDKLGATSVGPFDIMKRMGNKALQWDLPAHVNSNPVIHDFRTVPYSEPPSDISKGVLDSPDQAATIRGNAYLVAEIGSRRPSGRRHQFLNRTVGEPMYPATWFRTKNFVHSDLTSTEWFMAHLDNNYMGLTGTSIRKVGEYCNKLFILGLLYWKALPYSYILHANYKIP